MIRNIQNSALFYVAHWTGNFFSFPKHPLQFKFRSSVQVLWKLLVCIDGVESLQTNNFHKIWTDDQNLTYEGCFGKEKKFQYNELCFRVLGHEWNKAFRFEHFNV